MSLMSSMSSRLGDSSIVQATGQFFNTATKKTVIVMLAVAAIIALGVYLLRAGDCLRRFRATTPTPQLPTSEPSPSSVPPAYNEELLKVPPSSVFESGRQRGITHYKRSDTMEGWILIRANSEGNIESRTFFPFDPSFLVSQFDRDLIENEAPNLDGCISAQEVERALAEQSPMEETSLLMMPETRASQVPLLVYIEGEHLGATHYLHKGGRMNRENGYNWAYYCEGWIIINDRDLTSVLIPARGDRTPTVCPYPTDTTGSITAEEVRACRPTGNWINDRDNETNIPPEFIFAFGEEHGATAYMYDLSHDCWHVFCGERSYGFRRNGVYAQIPGREIPPQASDWFDQDNFFTAEQVKAHYEQVRPRQPDGRSSIEPGTPNESRAKLIQIMSQNIPARVANFGENCRATHYESRGDDWVIYCGESQSYVYRENGPDEGFSRQPGQSIEVLNQRLESDPLHVFTPEQVSNNLKVQTGLFGQ